MESSNTQIGLIAAYRSELPRYLRWCGIVFVVVIAFTFIMPHTYTASTSLMPPETKSQSSGLSSLLQSTPIAIGLGSTDNKTALVHMEILRSRTLIEGIIDTLHLDSNELYSGLERDDLVKLLSSALTVENHKSGSLSISADVATGWFPFGSSKDVASKTCADIANASRMVLDKINRDKAMTQARRSRMYIERVLATTKHEIDSLQDSLEAFQLQHKVFALDEQMAAIVTNAVTIGTELAKAQLELNLAKQDYQSNSPQIMFLEKKVEALQEQYQSVQQGGIETTDGFSIPFEEVPTLTRAYTNLLRDGKIKEQVNAFLETQRMQEMIQEAKDTPTVVELDAAIAPKSRSWPSRLIMIAFSWLIVTLGFAGWVPLREIVSSQ